MTHAADPAVAAVAAWFRNRKTTEPKFATAIRTSIDEVLDRGRTGRWDINQLRKTEKTYLGTKVEILIENTFKLKRGRELDFTIAGHDVDAKWSLGTSWMIPQEAIDKICLCVTADDDDSTFSVGIIRATRDVLTTTTNRDRKHQISRAGMASMVWIARGAQLPRNLLLHVDDAIRSAILQNEHSGQERVNELFRQLPGVIIDRPTVETVARQKDPTKRVRDARLHLREEGIRILGRTAADKRLATRLGLPVPGQSEWLAITASGSAR